jgi:hypothetical protein
LIPQYGQRSRQLALITLAASLCCACASVAPMKEVRPEPIFIEAAVEEDDEVAIRTTDGRELSFVVASVENGTITGVDGQEVPFADIGRISIRSWSEPKHPCGGGEPVGCSLPEVVTAVSKFHETYKEYFYSACAEHDYCYRHGSATYGLTQAYCDDRFYSDMMAMCDEAGVSILGITNLDGLAERAKCRLAADQFYSAVQKYGHKAFRTTTSTYCEFDGADGPR